MNYDFWLLDLDGTIVDVEPRYRRAVFTEVGDRLGRAFTDDEVEALWHGLGGPRSDKLHAMGLDPGTFWPALHEAEDPGARAAATFIHDDAATLLDSLDERGAPVGVVTHCAPFLANHVVDHLDLRSQFDAFVTCSDELGWKPNPEPVHHAMNELGVTGDDGVLAGDGPSDVGAAWNAGLDAVHVERHGHDSRGQCVLADHQVESLEELDAIAVRN